MEMIQMIMRDNKGIQEGNHLYFSKVDKTSFFSREGNPFKEEISSFISAGFRGYLLGGGIFAGNFRSCIYCGYSHVIAYCSGRRKGLSVW
jgi:hypothetical protein